MTAVEPKMNSMLLNTHYGRSDLQIKDHVEFVNFV